MAFGYGLTMAALTLGWRLSRRAPQTPEKRTGWMPFILRLLGTALGGYLVLMAIVLLYYVAVAGQGRSFLIAAFTGNALVAFGIGVPALLVIAWVGERLRVRRERHPR